MDSAVTQYLYKYNIAQNFHSIKMQFTFSIGSMQIKIGGGGWNYKKTQKSTKSSQKCIGHD